MLSLVFAEFGVLEYWHEHDVPRAMGDIFVIGMLAGYLAPVVRDILARLQQRTA
jgi:hypothetical protein